jgi:ABC-2 type transport system permease protein
MGLTRWIRKKEHVRRLGMIFALFIVVAALSMVGLLKDVNFDGFAESLESGGVAFMNVMNIIFVGNFLLGKALEGSIVALLLYLLYHLFIISLFLVIADKLYIKGVVGILSGGDGASRKRNAKGMQLRTPAKSYLVKEFRTLFRTPAFLLNCVIVNFLWPLLIYVVYVMNKESSAFDKFWILYQTGNEGARWIVALAVFGISVLLTAMNSLGSSAITREGKYYYAMKYLPISYKKQLHMKALVSIIISSVFCFIYIILLSIMLNVDNAVSWYYLILSFAEIIFTTYFGLYLDTINPRLNWDDELNALRGNTNVFFNMAYAIMIAGAFAGIAYMLYVLTTIPLLAMEMILLVVTIVADILMVNICIKKGSENIEEMY